MAPESRGLAGQPAPASALIDVGRLIAAYHDLQPDPTVPAQRVAFGTSGHRGCAFDGSFNEWHVRAIAQAVCDHRRTQGIAGPLYLGVDTHALSGPAAATTLEVLAGNGVDVMLAPAGEFTPTPAVSHAILGHNRGRAGSAVADGIVITPSHNPPRDGGFKYNPPHGGPAGAEVTAAIQAAANQHLESGLRSVRHMPHAQALQAGTTHTHDYRRAYVAGLGAVLDMEAIRSAGLRLAVDPMGGAGVHYWGVIAERYRLNLDVIRTVVDPSFAFMTLDWDGQIRMDPSSPYAMQGLIALKDRYDVAFACDTDHDRHGIVTPTQGLLPPNHFLVVAIDYLFTHRPLWPARAGIGKTMVSTQLIDRVAARLKRRLWEVPAGFKWFAPGLLDGSLGFAGEESAGASFLRRDGTAWTTDKDGIAAALLAAEITARTGHNPGTHYARLARELGDPAAGMRSAAAAPQQKQRLAGLTARAVATTELAGEAIGSILTQAPGNGQALGGLKVSTATGWFAARPSGTENIYKIYAESFRGEAQLELVLQAAQGVVDAALLVPPSADLRGARSGSEQTAS